MKKKLTRNEYSDEMYLEDYKAIYDAIVSLSVDADGYGLYDGITEEDVEKCKWIAVHASDVHNLRSSDAHSATGTSVLAAARLSRGNTDESRNAVVSASASNLEARRKILCKRFSTKSRISHYQCA